ncbi:hypothetical protein Q0F98_10815 [Paenibacillus amylolyticus]|nr:hypothetical protein Q0F98_10815 [Paenibacillus amylolyticus]
MGTILAVTEGIPVSAVITDSMPSQFEVIVSSELRRWRLPLFPLAQLIPRIWFWRLGESLKSYRQRDPVMMLNERRRGCNCRCLWCTPREIISFPRVSLNILCPKPIRLLNIYGSTAEDTVVPRKIPPSGTPVIPFLKTHVQGQAKSNDSSIASS